MKTILLTPYKFYEYIKVFKEVQTRITIENEGNKITTNINTEIKMDDYYDC